MHSAKKAVSGGVVSRQRHTKHIADLVNDGEKIDLADTYNELYQHVVSELRANKLMPCR